MTLFVILGTVIGKHRPATPAEVAEAHPKCGTCGFKLYSTRHGVDFCFSPASPMRAKIVDPALDYCRFHSELNTENNDDKPE